MLPNVEPETARSAGVVAFSWRSCRVARHSLKVRPSGDGGVSGHKGDDVNLRRSYDGGDETRGCG